MTREDILEIAGELISGERGEEYGDAKESFQRIADLWSAYRGDKYDMEDVALMMILVKVSRLKHTKKHPDSWVDIAGYAALGGAHE